MGCLNSLDWTAGLDYWTGLLDWITGLDYWTETFYGCLTAYIAVFSNFLFLLRSNFVKFKLQ